MDYTKMTFEDMEKVVRSIWGELKRRNPIGVNFYTSHFREVIADLSEIHEAEKGNPTCEAGPGID